MTSDEQFRLLAQLTNIRRAMLEPLPDPASVVRFYFECAEGAHPGPRSAFAAELRRYLEEIEAADA